MSASLRALSPPGSKTYADAMAKREEAVEGNSGVEPRGYEESRAALADVVAALEAGDMSLEDALTIWERGETYANECERWLLGAQQRLTEQSAEPSD